MPPRLQWASRPATLIALSVVLVGVAAIVAIPWGQSRKPQPLPLAPGDQEVAWLYPATSSTSWARFVAAVEYASRRLQTAYPGLRVERVTDLSGEGASRPTTSPEVVLAWDGPGRLVFRWYKLTGDWTAADWVEALLRRSPAPLAVIGGNTSEWARRLVLAMRQGTAGLPPERRPLLLVTTATADTIPRPDDWEAENEPAEPPGRTCGDYLLMLRRDEAVRFRDVPPPAGDESNRVHLTHAYPRRTFRFGFTNRQMASAVTRFIWNRPDLRPDADPAFLVQWQDDAYSVDLLREYRRVLPCRVLDRWGEQAALHWGQVAGAAGAGLHPVALAQPYLVGMGFDYPFPLSVDSSVGMYSLPNPFEARVVGLMLEQLETLRAAEGAAAAAQRRFLLVITGQAQPARRLLRDLARSAPETTRRFVVTTGDALAFNAIYRDRQVTWPIQDLPFRLVMFCHRNPVDRDAGFRPLPAPGEEGDARPGPTAAQTSGTEDLLLFGDVVEALALAFRRDGSPCQTPDDLAAGLLAVHLHDGRLGTKPEGVALFRSDGQRNPGTGEHVVTLLPAIEGDRVLPRATIEVWRRHTDRAWRPQGPPLVVGYEGAGKFPQQQPQQEPGKGGGKP